MKFKNHFIQLNWFKIGKNNYDCFLAKIYTCHHGKRVFYPRINNTMTFLETFGEILGVNDK